MSLALTRKAAQVMGVSLPPEPSRPLKYRAAVFDLSCATPALGRSTGKVVDLRSSMGRECTILSIILLELASNPVPSRSLADLY